MQETFDSLTEDGRASSEQAFDSIEKAAVRLQQSFRNATTQARKLAVAARMGDLRAMQKGITALTGSLRDIDAARGDLTSHDLRALERRISGSRFLSEVQQLAQRAGLDGIQIGDSALLSYPHRLIFDPTGFYRIGRRVVRAVRPSAIVERLRKERGRVPAITQAFLEALEHAYFLVNKDSVGISVPLEDVYETLTMLPGSRKEYAESDFIRDIGLIDERGPHVTKQGNKVSFPASTSARMNRGFSAVNSRGDEISYASIRFDRSGV